MSIEAVFITKRIVPPESFTKRIYGNDFSGITSKRFKQSVFFGCQGDNLATLMDFGPAEINRTSIQYKQRRILFVGSPQYRIDTQ